MPINFVTGLPRAGKTLWTLSYVKAKAEREKRQVYYCNIPGVTIPGWIEIKHPDEWLSLPDGAFIVVDELQDFWGKQPTGAKVPAPILELSKHGKRGFDFFFITQEPELVHTTPRGLCQFHYYVIRAFGAGGCVIYKFQRMQTHPEKVKAKGEKFPWKYNKDAFTWYKSADVHNIKREIPKKVIAIPFAILLVIAAVWAAIAFFGRTTELAKNSGKTVASAGGAQPLPGAANGAAAAKPIQTPAEYVASYQPRIPGLAHTAPAYDTLTVAKVVPVPAACVEMKTLPDGCKCWTQQATPYDTTPSLCRQIARNGVFLAFIQPSEVQPRPEPEKRVEAAYSPPSATLIENAKAAPGAATTVASAGPTAQPRVQPGSKWSFQSGGP
jgi:zona occludens toxin